MRENLRSEGFVERVLSWLVAFLAISAAYLYTFPRPTVLYAGVVLLHALGGVIAAILLLLSLFRRLRQASFVARSGWLLVAAGPVLGIILIKTGTSRPEWKWLYLHIAISLAGVAFLIAGHLGRRGWMASNAGTAALRAAICVGIVAGVGYGARYIRESWQTRGRIQNPAMPPDTMNAEGDG